MPVSKRYNHPELDDLSGQMHFFERRKLREWVYRKKPSIIFEAVSRNDILIISPDFIFFDGPEHPELNLQDFKMLEEIVPVGTMFASHDWEVEERIEGGFSIKNAALRPYLENSESWKEIECLSGVMGEWPNEESENSVGLALYEKVK